MSEPEAAACFAPEHLARFLDERLDEAEGLRITAHLGTCESCRTTLERVAGDPDHWAGAREHIETVTAFDAEPIPEKSDPDGLEEIRRLCDPTDDPASVGRIGAYEVRGFVGRGTAGIVLKAFEPSLDRFVAIKLLSPVFRGHGATRQRFEREARAIAAVRDPHVVPVHGVDEHHGLPFLVMGYVPGESLEERIKRTGPLGTEAAARVGLQVARALAAAHAQGVVHRDVKPANVLLEGTVERAFVTDFGLASVADEAAITLSGMISGTPHYMSPEQARGEVVDARSDLFSLGSLLYAACAGEPPFKAENVYGVLRRVTETEPLPLAETDARVDPWMAALVDRLLKKDPADRFQTAAEVADVLAAELAFAQNPLGVAPPARDWMPPAEAPGGGGRRRRAAAALACAAAGLGALAVAVLREDPETDRSGSGAALLGGVGVPSAGGLPEGVALVPEDEEEAPDVGGIRQIGRANRGILVRAGQIADKTLGAVQRLNLADLDRAPSAFELAEADLEEFFDGQAVGEIVRAATREATRFDPVALKGIDDLLPATLTNAFRVPPPPPVPTPDAQRTFGFAAIGPLDGAPEICIDAEVSPELVNAFCAPEDEECAAELESGGLFTVCTDDEGAFLERGTGQNPVRFLGAAARTLDGLVGDTVDASERGTLRSVRLEAPVGNVDGLSLYLPADYREGREHPVIVYLQGSAGVGGDLEESARAGLLAELTGGTAADALREDFIVVAPHITGGQYHDHPEVIDGLLDRVLEHTSADASRVHLTGACLGGHGSWGLVRTLRGRFASVAPLGADPEDLDGELDSLEGVSVWIGHNGRDTSYPLEHVDELAGEIEVALRAEFLRGDVGDLSVCDVDGEEWIFTSDPRGEHDAWSAVYASDAFYGWLHGQVHCRDTWGTPRFGGRVGADAWDGEDEGEGGCSGSCDEDHDEECDDDCEDSCGESCDEERGSSCSDEARASRS